MYRNVNGQPASRSVWMNIAGLTGRYVAPLKGPLAARGELGLGIVTRSGFEVDGAPAIQDASYATVLLGAGLEYRLSEAWDLSVSATYSPSKRTVRQPHTALVSGGVTYNLRALSAERVRANATSGFVFPRNKVQVGYSSNAAGIGVNDFVSATVPIFWGGLATVKRGVAVHYERNVFHGRRLFSLDCGASLGYWKSAHGETFFTAAVFPIFRITPVRRRSADLYFAYSVAGPAAISRVSIGGQDTGTHFTFQDLMGIGAYLGKARRTNVEIRIGHYSNGNLFPKNAGVMIPVTLGVGYTF